MSAELPSVESRPPPLPWRHRRISRILFRVVLGGTAVFWASVFALWATERLRPYHVPTGAMSPAIKPGDHILAEGVTFLFREPRRGDVVVFRTSGITDGLPRDQGRMYVMRLAGLPGDRVRIDNGDLFVNDEPFILRNDAGKISYTIVHRPRHFSLADGTFAVPPKHYFVLGDNSPDSADSRYWGYLPAENICSRAVWCYWPLNRFGSVQ